MSLNVNPSMAVSKMCGMNILNPKNNSAIMKKNEFTKIPNNPNTSD